MPQESLYTFTKVFCTACDKEITKQINDSPSIVIKCPSCSRVLAKTDRFSGIVYVLSNPAFDHLLKIGFTTRSIDERIAQLNGTNIPEKFECVAAFHSHDPQADEKRIHVRLAQFRAKKNREFFEISRSIAIQTCQNLIGRKPFLCTYKFSEDELQPESQTPTAKSLIKKDEFRIENTPRQILFPADPKRREIEKRQHFALVIVVVVLAMLIKIFT